MDALYEKIIRGGLWSSDDYDELFQRPDAQELVEMAIISGISFVNYEDRFFTLPFPSKVIKLFIFHDEYWDDGIIEKIFELPDAEDIIYLLILNAENFTYEEKIFSENVIAQMFSLPHASKIIKLYVLTGRFFSAENEAKIFGLPNAGEIVKLYLLKGNSLSEENHHKILNLPNGAEIAALITRFGYLEDDVYHQAKERGWI